MSYLSELILMFAIYSFLGWLCESIYCSIPVKRFVNRGFLNGPFCPVYGFGGILVTKLLTPFLYSVPLLFLAAVIITSTLEYGTAYLLEKLFHAKWWDYSNQRFHIHGRVCLRNSLLFGVMSVVTMLFVHPLVQKIIGVIPKFLLPVIATITALCFTADTIVTVRTILQLNGKIAELQQVLDELRERTETAKAEYLRGMHEKLEDFMENMDVEYQQRVQSLRERQAQLENESKLLQRRVLRAFPHMRSVRNNESLSRLKEALKARKLLLKQSKNKD